MCLQLVGPLPYHLSNCISSRPNHLFRSLFSLVAPDDTPKDVESLANKILKLKLWDSEDGSRWKTSVIDMDYQVLLVSQFTLLATIKKGSKPDFHGACPPSLAKDIYTSLLRKTREVYVKEKKLAQEDGNARVQDGVFGAMMQVALINDGPVTFEVSTTPKDKEAVAGGIKTRGKVQGKPKRENGKEIESIESKEVKPE